jgi:hypothetical protein
MKRQPKPIQISPELAARFDGSDQAERMDQLFRAVVSTPRATVSKNEDEWKRKRAEKK